MLRLYKKFLLVFDERIYYGWASIKIGKISVFQELYESGMNVGRNIIGTMSNILILAFAGSSLNTLIIIVLYKLLYIRLINLDLISIELIQGIAGSIGIVLTVPITAFCAAFLATRKKEG